MKFWLAGLLLMLTLMACPEVKNPSPPPPPAPPSPTPPTPPPLTTPVGTPVGARPVRAAVAAPAGGAGWSPFTRTTLGTGSDSLTGPEPVAAEQFQEILVHR